MPLLGGSRWASRERSKVLASKARGSGPCKMVRRPGMLRGQVGARVVPALKAGTGRQQRHEQRWGLGSTVLTIGLGTEHPHGAGRARCRKIMQWWLGAGEVDGRRPM